MLRSFWHDDGGAVVSPELAVIGAILVVGLLVGLSSLSSGMFTEIEDIGEAVEAFDFTPTMVPGTTPPPPNVVVQNPGSARDGKPIGNIVGNDGGPGQINSAPGVDTTSSLQSTSGPLTASQVFSKSK